MRRPASLFIYAASAVVAAAVIVGLVVIPAPWEQRKKDLDEARVRDLIALSNVIATYYRSHARLPAAVQELPGAPRLADVETKAPYEYIVNNLRDYQLCANFESNSAKTMQSFPPESSGWKHGKGHYCFSVDIPASIAPP
jgi:hypothetical protein